MTLKIADHPYTFGRLHLPVAPKCNIQCNYCSREFDCLNENRPRVTSKVLSPQQALYYLEQAMALSRNIAVVGIAGPGDPFANPDESMETLRLVRDKYPEMPLCVSTNGLDLLPYIDELARLQVSHVTITINAIDPQIGAEIYSWGDVRRLHMETIIQLPLQLLMSAQCRLGCCNHQTVTGQNG
jgi:nitrogen fixation protein NifB